MAKVLFIVRYDSVLDPIKFRDYNEKMVNEGLGAQVAKRVLKAGVDEYKLWLEGEVYGYILAERETCLCCGRDVYTELSSCWGFYGPDPHTNGISFYVDIDNCDVRNCSIDELPKFEEVR